MKIEIKNRYTKDVLFGHEQNDNSIKITLQAAVQAGANLRDADLRGADLRSANLRDANLRGADLDGAKLVDADLRGADLRGSCLRDSCLRHADLRYADLRGADLRGAYLRDARICGAELDNADLRDADLRGVKNVYDSHCVLAHIAISYDESLIPVAAMIAGGLVGCWREYTECIRDVFGEDTISKLTAAWLQDESWGVRERLIEHGWISQ